MSATEATQALDLRTVTLSIDEAVQFSGLPPREGAALLRDLMSYGSLPFIETSAGPVVAVIDLTNAVNAVSPHPWSFLRTDLQLILAARRCSQIGRKSRVALFPWRLAMLRRSLKGDK